MSRSTRSRQSAVKHISAATLIAAACTSAPANASNAAFQDFFFLVCATPSGTLTTRCGETDSGLGNLSGDSESSLNPSQTLSTSDAAMLAAQQRSQEIRERMRARRDSDEGLGDEGAKVDLGPFSLLLNARTANTESDRVVDVDAERGYELDETSAELGLDYRFSDTLVWGAWLQWGTSELEFVRENPGNNFTPLANAGTIDTDRLGFTTYLSAQLGETGFVDASLGLTSLEADVSRGSVFQESNRVIAQTDSLTAASTDGDELMFTLTAGWQANVNSWNITPFVGVTHVDTEFDDYVESDLSAAGLALGVSLGDRSMTIGQAGVTISNAISMDGWVFLPQARIEYLSELSSDRSEAEVRFLNDTGNNRFSLQGDDLDDDRLDISVGFAGVFPNGWIPFLEYQVTTGASNLDRYQVAAGLRIEL